MLIPRKRPRNPTSSSSKTDKSARRGFFYHDETDLMAVRIDGWKMLIGVKPEGIWSNEKYYPNVPCLFNLLMDPMEKMDPEPKGWGYIGRKFFATKMWAPNAAVPFVAAHLKSLMEYPPRQAADTLSIKKALDAVMKKLEDPSGANKEALADGRPESAIRSFNHTGCSCKQPATSQATEKT